ncbi:MAG TPA: dTDP-4-dehydrorhamnose reductase [Jiangellales bacterium]|nr:dTDP-4-dehydrorhamnose reductase [Jiangellales bacterium]
MTGAPPGPWLVTGAGGMLGRDVVAAARRAGVEVTAAARADLDVTDPATVRAAVAGHAVVVNCAAWTAVDDAEAHEAEAAAVNAEGPRLLAEACAASGARLVQVSTDYVFAGDGAPRPYAEDDPVAPRSAYGRGKAAGEAAVRAALPDRSYVLRTAWLYGEEGPSFVRTVLRLAAEREVLDVVDDQHGQPTWSRDVARRLVEVVTRGAPAGTYHATAAGETTWYGLAREVLRLAGDDPDRVRPTTTAAFPRPAPRPAWSVLGHDGWERAGLPPLRGWRPMLAEALPLVVAATRR